MLESIRQTDDASCVYTSAVNRGTPKEKAVLLKIGATTSDVLKSGGNAKCYCVTQYDSDEYTSTRRPAVKQNELFLLRGKLVVGFKTAFEGLKTGVRWVAKPILGSLSKFSLVDSFLKQAQESTKKDLDNLSNTLDHVEFYLASHFLGVQGSIDDKEVFALMRRSAQFLKAIQDSDYLTAKTLLKQGVDVLYLDCDKKSALDYLNEMDDKNATELKQQVVDIIRQANKE